ncbi:hypothetical protein ACXR0O_14165 [Verrucomicrobiota bacterium sgz303538]
MKAFPALLLAVTLLAPTLRAQQTPATPAPPAPAPAPETPATVAPAAPKPDLTPAKDLPTPMPSKSLDLMPAQDTPTPVPITPESTLVPETPESTPKPTGSAIEEPKKKDGKEKPNKTEVAADQLAARVRYREVKTRALKDPAVQAEWSKSLRAHTDFEKRAALKSYYKLLFARMENLDSSLKKEIASHQTLSIRRLEQTRVEATETPDADLRAARTDLE